MPELTPVQEYYKDKTVFITGVSGFMGKVMLEKLLYSCSELKEIIVVCRPRKEKSPQKRVEAFFDLPIFQRIRDEKPYVFKKVTTFDGDIGAAMLGMSGENLKYVCDNTNIVFHMAASLELGGDFKNVVDINLSGTKRALDVAKKMKNLECFVHVSTCFCNVEEKTVYEKVYDFPHKPEDLMRLIEWMEPETLNTIAPNLMKEQPNAYTYSKRLSELLVRDLYDTMPVVIARPSFVLPAAFEPLPGWVDNFNGPTGLTIACSKGLIRSVLADIDNKAEAITVDYAINGLIVIPYEFKKGKKPAEIPVYNITCAEEWKRPRCDLIELARRVNERYPLNAGLWYPDATVTKNKYYHRFNVIMFQWLPAYFIDFFLLIFGQRTFMVHIQRKIAAGMALLEFFGLHPWDFRSEKYSSLWLNLSPKDKKIFNMDMGAKKSEEEFMIDCAKVARRYILKEKEEDYPRARLHLKIQYVVDRVCKIVIVGLFIYYLLKWTGILALF